MIHVKTYRSETDGNPTLRTGAPGLQDNSVLHRPSHHLETPELQTSKLNQIHINKARRQLAKAKSTTHRLPNQALAIRVGRLMVCSSSKTAVGSTEERASDQATSPIDNRYILKAVSTTRRRDVTGYLTTTTVGCPQPGSRSA